jgi:kynureninase
MASLSLDALRATPNALAAHYTHFRVAERLLLTGHSHQAWPDVGFEGQQHAWLDAAAFVDDKWDRAFAKADRVREGWATLLGDATGDIALADNTHELVVRLLSALPLQARPRIVATDGEFHTVRRQLDRLAEEGLDIIKVPSEPVDRVAERLADAVDDRTALVVVSSVLYLSARIVRGLDQVADACRRVGAALLVDTYHTLNAIPFALADHDLDDAYVVGGGYKYCQLGEGNCFLRLPAACDLRPVITGWFSEFGELAEGPRADAVPYGTGPARFAGATYDPTSHYRAAAVFDFFVEQGLTPETLRTVSQHQVGLLARRFDELDLDPRVITRDRTMPLADLGGFLALHAPDAAGLSSALKVRGVSTDSRGPVLRFGPAPYLSDQQLAAAMDALGEVVRGG